jgi:hypothetical protein
MHTFTTYFKIELKRFLGIRNKIIIILVFILSLGFVQSGIKDYKRTLNLKSEFQEYEKQRVSLFVSHRQYGAYGVRMLFVPAPISTLFINTGVVPEMTAYIDAGERLNIYNPMIGKNVFGIKKFGFTDFSGILLFFGSLLALFYGYESLYYKEYLKTLASISGRIPVYFSLLVSRIFIILLLLLILIGSALLLMLINGLPIPVDAHVINFAFSLLLVSVFFFLLGTAIGTIKSKLTGIPTLLSCWFILLFVLPAAVDNYIENKANLIKPLYKLETEKFKIVMGFERRSFEEAGTLEHGQKITDKDKEIALGYLNSEFNKLHDLERGMLNEMRENLSHFQWVSIFSPTTNYLCVVNEISSRGYENLLDFYKYAQELKSNFARNIITKVYFANRSQVESFIKDDENVYYAASSLPRTFAVGVLATLVYIVLLTWVTYIRYRGILFYVPARAVDSRRHPDLRFVKGQYRIFSIESNLFLNRLYNLFAGYISPGGLRLLKKKPEWSGPKIYVDDVDISSHNIADSFLYLCSPDSLPGDIKAGDFFEFITRLTYFSGEEKTKLYKRLKLNTFRKKRISQLKKQEKAELQLSLTQMHDVDIYLIYDIVRGMTRIFTVQFKDRMHELSVAGKLVLYLTTDTIISEEILEDDMGFIESTSNWTGMVESVRY